MRTNSFYAFCALIALLLFSVVLKGQEHYFNYRGKLIPLTISKADHPGFPILGAMMDWGFQPLCL